MKNYAVRRSIHLESIKYSKINIILVTNQIHSNIFYFTLFKIIFLLIFTVIQVNMITLMYGNVKIVNAIYINENKPIKNIFDSLL